MSEGVPRFPSYGDGGDCIGARRVRHAFRWCVVLLVSFASLLWLSERFFRYPHPERLYLSAITKPPEQARVFLRQAVLYDEKSRDIPTPKYLQALAGVEEEDLVLPSFEKALKADPGNWALAIQYGCRLFAKGKAADAQTQFQVAAENAPGNSLPLYLEAAALPWATGEDEGLRKALALIARANSSASPVTFPMPLWSSDLPQSGQRYAHICRETVDQCAAPLYAFIDRAAARAEVQLGEDRLQQWDSWLDHIETMGQHVGAGALRDGPSGAGNPLAGTSAQAHLGLSIQLFASRTRERIAEIESTGPQEAQMKQRIAIETAVERLRDFENGRAQRIEEARRPYMLPGRLCVRGLGSLLAAYMVAFALSKLMGAGGAYATVSHPSSARRFLAAAGLAMFVILSSITVFQLAGGDSATWMTVTRILWWVVLLSVAVVGAVYPYWALPSLRQACVDAEANPAEDEVIHAARGARRRAAGSLLRRYFGVALGLALCATSLWVIEYRIVMSLYPWQTNLVATGLADEESRLVCEVLGAPL
ncbi:MAG: hypothetical protein GY851_30235 [bacterium]|nr:hypothetical protein [bacterium]